MNVSGITDKITGTLYNNAELLGLLGGVSVSGIQTFIDSITAIPTSGHFPDVGRMIKEFVDPQGFIGKKNMEAVKLYLIGWGLKEAGFGGRLGPALQNASIGLIKGHAIQHVAYWSTH